MEPMDQANTTPDDAYPLGIISRLEAVAVRYEETIAQMVRRLDGLAEAALVIIHAADTAQATLDHLESLMSDQSADITADTNAILASNASLTNVVTDQAAALNALATAVADLKAAIPDGTVIDPAVLSALDAAVAQATTVTTSAAAGEESIDQAIAADDPGAPAAAEPVVGS